MGKRHSRDKVSVESRVKISGSEFGFQNKELKLSLRFSGFSYMVGFRFRNERWKNVQ